MELADERLAERDRPGDKTMDRRPAEGRDKWSPAPSSVESGTENGVKGEARRPFVLSEGLRPVPHKLAVRIIWGEYIDMAELLGDNLKAQK